MLSVALAAALALSNPAAQARPQTTVAPDPVTQNPATQEPSYDLEEIVVEGRNLEDATREFVREIAAPARNRGLARWRDGVCVGVVNLQTEVAEYIADRVSTVATDLGLRAGAPGCEPSILIIATVDANDFTRQFVASRPTLFRVGGSGMDLGRNALRAFERTDRPVRWWNVSVPVDSDTGQIAVRLPGDVSGNGAGDGSVMQYAPVITVRAASRLSTQIVDDSKRSFVIIDVDRLAGVSLEQLADYIAMISLAQVDPDADTSGYSTILNVFDDPQQTPGLTNWDKAYLQGLYDTVRTRQNQASGLTEIENSIIRAREDIVTDQETAADNLP